MCRLRESLSYFGAGVSFDHGVTPGRISGYGIEGGGEFFKASGPRGCWPHFAGGALDSPLRLAVCAGYLLERILRGKFREELGAERCKERVFAGEEPELTGEP
jgi:hypothetical protein